ncbi:hypothetical protein KY290_019530 [Solanum tuberosum]|uniref:Bax inhibitor n=1 Tax=Solanum tuberosum TaxID=4113 RepID=A0ABQ7VH98_SOLTU|nr:hypothetical protein KY284_018425 [Solanum tuberosum]KAH0691273.1 hypothetical protein KY289_018631 [Solanum tuberosum]KAH0704192.1 hypothetical protein KY285_018470 [Solanum tuberosum]KAH0763457.1 hypothetical protein KY290_019530 [Solanum tuberosum]
MNAVKAYFNRNWTREDLMNTGEISEYAYTSLTTVYLTLFCAMLSFTFGSFLQLIIWEVGGLFTVLSSVASLLWLYFASPLRVRLRVSLLMYAACTLGASFGLFTKYLFEIYPPLIVNLLEGSTFSIGIICIFVYGIDMLDIHTVHWVFKVNTVQALFMGYFVIYSQDLLYNAGIGEINFVDHTLAVFFHLPGIVVHAARVYLTAENEQHIEN